MQAGFRKLIIAVLVLALASSGCAINIGPPAADLLEQPRPPILRLGRINEELIGKWPGGGLRNHMVNAFSEPGVAGLFTKDTTALTLQIDVKATQPNDILYFVGMAILSLGTLGVPPIHYDTEWPATAEVKILTGDGRVLNQSTIKTKGTYEIWAFPLTMFSLLTAGLRAPEDGQKIKAMMARDLVAQIVRGIDAEYETLAAAQRSQVRQHTATLAAEQAGVAGLPRVVTDLDELPAAKVKLQNRKAYALVIGIEQYRQKLPTADYARYDAELVAKYLTSVMGYPEENVVTLVNERATNVDLAKYLEKWLPNNVEEGGSVFLYYSGHGAPNPRTGEAFLVPYDGDPAFIEQTGYPLKKVYEGLGRLKAKEIVVALDSCFSGAGGRSVLAEGARPLVMNLQSNLVFPKNLTVLSASAGDQISSTYKEKGHGLFTYFMLKGIKNEEVVADDGSLKLDDLFGYVKPQVERIARKQYNNEQTPQLLGAAKN